MSYWTLRGEADDGREYAAILDSCSMTMLPLHVFDSADDAESFLRYVTRTGTYKPEMFTDADWASVWDDWWRLVDHEALDGMAHERDAAKAENARLRAQLELVRGAK